MALPKGLITGVTAKLPGVPGDWKRQPNALQAAPKIVLPLPPRELSPNWRGHWAQKAKKVAWYRANAGTECKAAMHLLSLPTFDAVSIEPVFYFKDRRSRDKDNLLASLKAGFDGLADAGLVVNDSQITYKPVVIFIDKGNPRVELWISTD